MAITPINSFDLPVNNADFDTWGTKLNTIFGAIDTLLGSPANTIKGNNTGALAPTADLTTAQVAAMLPSVVGDSGAGGTKGLVPAPAAGDAAARKVLLASGAWGISGPDAIGRFVGSTGATVVTRGITVARTGVGAYNVTLSPAMPNTNYIVQVPIDTTFPTLTHPTISAKTNSSFSVTTNYINLFGSTVDPIDPSFINIVIFSV